jgi:hypothetical protein
VTDFPRSLIEFQQRFPDEAACVKYLFMARWPEGFVCPDCGKSKAWQLQTKPWTWECAGCSKQTSVTAGTIMHHSKLPLTIWFWAAYLMATHSNGISALQLQRQLGLGSYRSAWLLCGKLRRSMVAPGRSALAGLVEIDETEIPCRSKNDPLTGGSDRSRQGKMLIVGAVEIEDGGAGPGRIRLAELGGYVVGDDRVANCVIEIRVAAAPKSAECRRRRGHDFIHAVSELRSPFACANNSGSSISITCHSRHQRSPEGAAADRARP